MLKDNQSLETFITNNQSTLESELLRYLLSDQVSVPLSSVLSGHGNPTDYADKIMSTHRYDLYYRFFEDGVKDHRCINYLVDGWMFDAITSAAITLRTMMVRPDHLSHIYELTTKASMFMTRLSDTKISETYLSGLATYASSACDFITAHPSDFSGPDKDEIFRLISNVGDITEEDWFLHNRTWQSVFLNYPERLQLLRTFLHMAIVQYVIPQNYIEDHFGVDRSTIFTLMYDFSDIRETSRQYKKDILDFLARLRMHCDMMEGNPFFDIVFDGPFQAFQHVHALNYHATRPTEPDQKVEYQKPKISVSYRHLK